jgi:hypothetical protein
MLVVLDDSLASARKYRYSVLDARPDIDSDPHPLPEVAETFDPALVRGFPTVNSYMRAAFAVIVLAKVIVTVSEVVRFDVGRTIQRPTVTPAPAPLPAAVSSPRFVQVLP